MQLRHYQKQLKNRLLSILKAYKYAFLQSPTGTGKTTTSLVTSLELLKGKNASVIWVAHQNYLVAQSSDSLLESFKSLGYKGDKDGGEINGIKFQFMTWQKLNSYIKKGVDLGKHDLLVIDEAHYGSSGESNDHKSFKKILESDVFAYKLFVSATSWDLNSDVYGKVLDEDGRPLKNYLAIYTLAQAAEDGFLHDVDFYVVNTVDTMKLSDLENGVEEDMYDSDMKSLAKKTKDKKVNIKHKESKRVLRKSVVQSLLESYLTKEVIDGVIPPTMIFCSSIDDENDPRSLSSVRAILKVELKDRGFGVGKDVVYDYHSKMDKKATTTFKGYRTPIDAFRANKFKILLVVSTAQEGFDKPNLDVIVDLAPSFDNAKRFMQKNRLTRKHSSKVRASRYYVPDLLTNHLIVKSEKTKLTEEGRKELIKQTGITKEIKAKGFQSSGNKIEDVFCKIALFGSEQIRQETGEDVSKIRVVSKGVDKVVTKSDKNTYIAKVGLVVAEAESKNKKVAVLELKRYIEQVNRRIKNITEENLLYMLRTGKVDERIYEQ